MQKIPQKLKKDFYWLIKDKYHGKQPKTGKRLAQFIKDVKQLKQGEPLDYIIGWKPFLDCKIDLSFKPHAPVPETEFWVEKFIESIQKQQSFLSVIPAQAGIQKKMGKKNVRLDPRFSARGGPASGGRGDDNQKKPLRILDPFSGSGCIGLAVLKSIRNAKVDFAEYEPRLIKQIKKNLKINRVSPTRYRVIHSNILENVKMSYDYILANPPYIAKNNENELKPWVKDYWPLEALFGGKDGFYFIRRFLKDAKSRLVPGGQIWMEFDPRQKNQIARIIKKNKYSSHAFHRDQFERIRYVVIER